MSRWLIRRVLEQLAPVVAVALGRHDLRRRLDVQDALLAARVVSQPPGRADGDHDVVARPVAQRPEVALESSAALVDEEHLVRFAVAVEEVVGQLLGGAHDAHHDVAVEEQRHAPLDHVAARRDGAGLDQSVAMHAIVGRLEPDVADGLDLVRPRRRDEVVEEGRAAGEALHAEQLLGVERSIRRAMLGVPLVRDVAARYVEHAAILGACHVAGAGSGGLRLWAGRR